MGEEGMRRVTFAVCLPLDGRAISGLVAGAVQAAAFNPFDRALFLSITQNRQFWHLDNWRSPFQGFSQAFFQRSLQGGIYFPLEDIFKKLFARFQISQALRDVFVGKCAGAVNGLLLNPLSVIKYNMWTANKDTFWGTASELYRLHGCGSFFRGVGSTVLRDVAFGAAYTSMRHYLRRRFPGGKLDHLKHDLTSAVLATFISAPFNYARNVQYASARLVVPSIMDTWRILARKTLEQPTKLDRFRFAQRSLGIGWGTARVTMAFAFGAFVYETLMGKSRGFVARG
ncbi:hypothetical protein NDN08_003749 [Rhodosorus marinus]|uniref:ADP/ATP translocase n=1 Tax=Rhodosorus marinus TaxID=101924 RepID=A0AAV8UGC7_9RHOD|nr:hypothetical protein NDN08_003749 [Rhodosorus marinus]